MSQRNVENLIGRLVTDEAFRGRFSEDPGAALQEVTECGIELTNIELRALVTIDWRLAGLFADSIDPRIQKVSSGTSDPESHVARIQPPGGGSRAGGPTS